MYTYFTFFGADKIFPMQEKANNALCLIDEMLRSHGKRLTDYPSLPLPTNSFFTNISNHLILQELQYDRHSLKQQSDLLRKSLNQGQRNAFTQIISAVNEDKGGFFFVYGFGGTGKTFLWNALASTLRGEGKIVLTVASSGIAATLLPGGRTAHSRFAIPLQTSETSFCNIKKKSPLSELLRSTSLIIWDEAPMVHKHCMEALDRTLKDIMQSTNIFGGICVVMGGDFRQILPVIPKGSRASIVDSCISSSTLWKKCKIFKLMQNMRLGASIDQ